MTSQATLTAAAEVAEAVAVVRSRIAEAARPVGRELQEVMLVAVTKGVPAERIAHALAAGVRHLGENRVQEATEHQREIMVVRGDRDVQPTWHMIGHLQRNKVRYVVDHFDTIDSVDSLHLARTVDGRVNASGRRMPVLLQVNVSAEETKGGFAVEDMRAVMDDVLALRNLEVQGLMTIGPLTNDLSQQAAAFDRLYELAESLRVAYPEVNLKRISMGMSGDFELAIEAGATEVRIGSLLFGPRHGRDR